MSKSGNGGLICKGNVHCYYIWLENGFLMYIYLYLFSLRSFYVKPSTELYFMFNSEFNCWQYLSFHPKIRHPHVTPSALSPFPHTPGHLLLPHRRIHTIVPTSIHPVQLHLILRPTHTLEVPSSPSRSSTPRHLPAREILRSSPAPEAAGP